MRCAIIRKDILNIEAYQPGKPIQEVQRELGLKDVVKLASNENALGPCPKAVRAIREALTTINRYPEGTCFYLKRKLARCLNVKESNLIFGNGSDELIDIILKTVRCPGAQLITSDVTFVEYKIIGSVNDFIVTVVPLKDFKYDLEAIKRAISKNTKVIFIANPNNPTGTYVNAEEVGHFLADLPQDILIVFDEAYIEYVQDRDFPKLIPLIGKKNIIILRTFSKIYGLAGLRIGYMMAADSFIEYAQRVRQPFNVNSLAQAAALAALDDPAFVRRSKALIQREKKFLYNAFTKMGIWFKESATNFIFIRLNADMRIIFQQLLQKGVIIREMSQYNLNNYARITIGTRKENLKFIHALEEIYPITVKKQS